MPLFIMGEYSFPGIFWPDKESVHHLAERILVSSVKVVDDPEGRRFYNDWAILPGQPRPITADELTAIVAPPEAKNPIMLIKLSPEIGQAAMEAELDPARGQARLVAPGITGMLYARREDLPGEPSATKVQRTINGTPQTVELGMHIDHWPESNDRSQQLAVINFGPGRREHLITPDYNFNVIGSYMEDKVAQYVRQDLANTSQPPKLCYWIRIDPPDEKGRVSALIHSPVAQVVHDGIVTGPEHSVFGGIRIQETDEDLLSRLAISYIQELNDRG